MLTQRRKNWMMLSHLQKPPREANFQFTPPAASIPFPRRVSPPLSPSLSGSPPPPPFSSARLPAPHASARHGPAWIWRRVAAYLPRLLVGERTLEVVLLLLCSTLGASRWPRPPLAPSGVEAGAASPAASAAACSSGTGEEERVAFFAVDPAGCSLPPAAARR